jgi:ribonuclease E
MTKKILIDASHPEETRVVMLDGNRLEDFDVESASRRQIKGNIYLAKVIRVEPSLQAAFVEYGGNRHGFLAFGEIHPDYYQIPVADRKKLLALQAEEADEEDEAAERAERRRPARGERNPARDTGTPDDTDSGTPDDTHSGTPDETNAEQAGADTDPQAATGVADDAGTQGDHEPSVPDTAETEQAAMAQPLSITAIEIHAAPPPEDDAAEGTAPGDETATRSYEPTDAPPDAAYDDAAHDHAGASPPDSVDEPPADEPATGQIETIEGEQTHIDSAEPMPEPESLGGDGDDAAEARERRQRQRFLRNYKIQDVIHRRQIMLIQVVKEERGNKGAALTTYLSLAGRYSVLMPNSPSGGGVSRKITSVADRRRLKEAMAELDVPDGMGLIVRTAGANRPKPEIVRDCEYLLRLWDDIRERTMESTAPSLIYEEASLIKRTIRDVYTRDVDEVLVDGDDGYHAARDFMRMLMPAHARKVQLWSEGQPLFARHQVEAQLDAMLNPTVQLRSGGYIVINQTEALVAIDVNSGRSTRERSIEDTALRTNLEAADEAARQLRMRDLAGLVVIDFIDMENRRNNAAVERRMKDALKSDRARIQVGPISHFGLMELSRQRLRPSLAEASLTTCPHCQGQGVIRSPESAALHILRAIEDEGGKFRAAEIAVFLPPEIAFYLFNHKRERISAIEARYDMKVVFSSDAALTGTNFRIEKVRAQTAAPAATAPASYGPVTPQRSQPIAEDTDETEDDEATGEGEDESADAPVATDTAEEGERKRRRRRRRGKRREGGESPAAENAAAGDAIDPSQAEQPSEFDTALEAELGEGGEAAAEATGEQTARRRRSRGGRRRRGEGETREAAPQGVTDTAWGEAAAAAPAEPQAPPAYSPPVYTDIADIFEAAERAEAQARERRDHARQAQLAAEAAPAQPQTVPPYDDHPAPAEAAPAEAAPVMETAEAAPESPTKPTLVGEAGVETEKKRGWWRR